MSPMSHNCANGRPSGEALQREIRRLWSTGLTARDISTAIRVPMADVLTALHPIYRSLKSSQR